MLEATQEQKNPDLIKGPGMSQSYRLGVSIVANLTEKSYSHSSGIESNEPCAL